MSGDEIRLDRKGSSQSLQLRRGQRHELQSDNNADIFSFTGGRPEDTFLASLGEIEERDFTGLATAPALSSEPDYSDDWKTALSEYAQRLEAFGYSRQHEGYDLVDNNRGDNVDVCLTQVEWELESGAIYQLSYDLTIETGVGAMPDDPISIDNATPGGDWELDGNNLGNFEYVSVTRDPQTNTNVRAFGSGPEENDIITETAAERIIEFRGVKTGTNSELNSFEDTMESLVKDEIIAFNTHFPGYSKNGMLMSFSSERQADWGRDTKIQYDLEFREGSRG